MNSFIGKSVDGLIYPKSDMRSWGSVFQSVLISTLGIVAVSMNIMATDSTFTCNVSPEESNFASDIQIQCMTNLPYKSVQSRKLLNPELNNLRMTLVDMLNSGHYEEIQFYFYISQIYVLLYFTLKIPNVFFNIFQSKRSFDLESALKVLQDLGILYKISKDETEKTKIMDNALEIFSNSGFLHKGDLTQKTPFLIAINIDYMLTIAVNLAVISVFTYMCPYYQGFMFWDPKYMNICYPEQIVCEFQREDFTQYSVCYLVFNKVLRYLQQSVFMLTILTSIGVCLDFKILLNHQIPCRLHCCYSTKTRRDDYPKTVDGQISLTASHRALIRASQLWMGRNVSKFVKDMCEENYKALKNNPEVGTTEKSTQTSSNQSQDRSTQTSQNQSTQISPNQPTQTSQNRSTQTETDEEPKPKDDSQSNESDEQRMPIDA